MDLFTFLSICLSYPCILGGMLIVYKLCQNMWTHKADLIRHQDVLQRHRNHGDMIRSRHHQQRPVTLQRGQFEVTLAFGLARVSNTWSRKSCPPSSDYPGDTGDPLFTWDTAAEDTSWDLVQEPSPVAGDRSSSGKEPVAATGKSL